MKKLLIALSILVLSVSAYAADKDTGTVAELYEHPHGRSVIFDKSELITIWHTQGTGGFGVSGTVATANVDRSIKLYEDGQEIATDSTRFGGYSYVSFDDGGETGNTVQSVVDFINSDSSGYFKAAVGRDATPGTTTWYCLAADIITPLASDKATAISRSNLVYDDTSSSGRLMAGFEADGRKTYRLKSIAHNFKGGTGDNGAGQTTTLRVWDGENVVYRRVWGIDTYQAQLSTSITPATASTVSFTDYNGKGLCASRGKNLTVTMEKGTNAVGNSEETTNMSIIVGEWTE